MEVEQEGDQATGAETKQLSLLDATVPVYPQASTDLLIHYYDEKRGTRTGPKHMANLLCAGMAETTWSKSEVSGKLFMEDTTMYGPRFAGKGGFLSCLAYEMYLGRSFSPSLLLNRNNEASPLCIDFDFANLKRPLDTETVRWLASKVIRSAQYALPHINWSDQYPFLIGTAPVAEQKFVCVCSVCSTLLYAGNTCCPECKVDFVTDQTSSEAPHIQHKSVWKQGVHFYSYIQRDQEGFIRCDRTHTPDETTINGCGILATQTMALSIRRAFINLWYKERWYKDCTSFIPQDYDIGEAYDEAIYGSHHMHRGNLRPPMAPKLVSCHFCSGNKYKVVQNVPQQCTLCHNRGRYIEWTRKQYRPLCVVNYASERMPRYEAFLGVGQEHLSYPQLLELLSCCYPAVRRDTVHGEPLLPTVHFPPTDAEGKGMKSSNYAKLEYASLWHAVCIRPECLTTVFDARALQSSKNTSKKDFSSELAGVVPIHYTPRLPFNMRVTRAKNEYYTQQWFYPETQEYKLFRQIVVRECQTYFKGCTRLTVLGNETKTSQNRFTTHDFVIGPKLLQSRTPEDRIHCYTATLAGVHRQRCPNATKCIHGVPKTKCPHKDCERSWGKHNQNTPTYLRLKRNDHGGFDLSLHCYCGKNGSSNKPCNDKTYRRVCIMAKNYRGEIQKTPNVMKLFGHAAAKPTPRLASTPASRLASTPASRLASTPASRLASSRSAPLSRRPKKKLRTHLLSPTASKAFKEFQARRAKLREKSN